MVVVVAPPPPHPHHPHHPPQPPPRPPPAAAGPAWRPAARASPPRAWMRTPAGPPPRPVRFDKCIRMCRPSPLPIPHPPTTPTHLVRDGPAAAGGGVLEEEDGGVEGRRLPARREPLLVPLNVPVRLRAQQHVPRAEPRVAQPGVLVWGCWDVGIWGCWWWLVFRKGGGREAPWVYYHKNGEHPRARTSSRTGRRPAAWRGRCGPRPRRG